MDEGFVVANSKNLNLKWSEIEKINKGLDPLYYLKVELSTGITIKFYHDSLTTLDDFEDLLKTLYQTLNAKKARANIGTTNNRVNSSGQVMTTIETNEQTN